MRWPWQKAENELDLEVRYHLETLADEFERQGMSRAEAMRRARAEFGGVEKVKDECRDECRWRWLMDAGQDVRFGWRMMRKTRAISAAAVITLALGIGATTAILTLADALLWRNLPVPAPEQLTEIFWTSKSRPEGLLRGGSGSTFPDGGLRVSDFFGQTAYEAMWERVAGKAQLAGHIYITPVSTSFEGVVRVADLRGVTGSFFPVLGLRPFLGRLLSDPDDRAEAAPVVVVTHRFWAQHLGGSADAAGKPIRINNTLYTIAGVLPPAFAGIIPGEQTDLYTPLRQSPQMLTPDSWYRKAMTDPTSWYMQLLARRGPGVTEDAVRAALEPAFAASWAAQPKSDDATPRLRLAGAARGLGSVRRRFGDPMWALLGLVVLVLLIACANIANLLLARSVAREKEVVMRVSLGCDAGRLMRQFMTESLLLAAIGGALSVGVAAMVGKLIRLVMPGGSEGITVAPETDPRALAGAAAVTICTAILFGLYPAWRASRGSGGPAAIARTRWTPARLLVLGQVALGVLLVSAAVVFAARLNEVTGQETGFDRGHVLLFDIRPGEVGYKGDRLRQFYMTLEERLEAVAGVGTVGLARTRPMMGGGYWDDVELVGGKKTPAGIHHGNAALVEALGVPIVAGRAMTAQEVRAGSAVVVLGENLARELEAHVGSRIRLSGKEWEVAGVAREARYSEMDRRVGVAYLPFPYDADSATVVIRTTVSPMAMVGAVREAMRGIDKDMPLVDVFTMDQQISRTLARERMFAWLCGSFGVLALVLCAVGLFGLMSHTTARRTGEIGLRMALGATRSHVMGRVLGEGLRLAFLGMALGAPLAVYAARIAVSQKLLPEGAVPYWTLGLALAVLAVAAVLAVLGPAMRASAVEPMEALRQG